jgi:ABC-type oligopeptide transport system ATPase subunit
MKKLLIILLAVVFLSTTAFVYVQQTRKTEAAMHPRIENAIRQLELAIDYMEKAPHDFGGHRVQAIADSRKAIVSLKLALAYRAKADNLKRK